MRRTLAALAWIIWQVTWCLPQNAAGLVIWLAHCRARQFGFRYARVTAWRHRSCTSMGGFIFMDERASATVPSSSMSTATRSSPRCWGGSICR